MEGKTKKIKHNCLVRHGFTRRDVSDTVIIYTSDNDGEYKMRIDIEEESYIAMHYNTPISFPKRHVVFEGFPKRIRTREPVNEYEDHMAKFIKFMNYKHKGHSYTF